MLKIIKSPWENLFVELLKKTSKRVFLASPYIKKQTAKKIAENTNKNIDIRYINSFKINNFYKGASDLEALRILLKNNAKLKNKQDLHAKIFIFDDSAIITSANLTTGGLCKNLEYGVLVQDSIVNEIKEDYLTIFNDPEIPNITEEIIKKVDNIISSSPREKQKSFTSDEKTLFETNITEDYEEKYNGGVKSIISNLKSWKKHIFECLEKIDNDIFSLDEVYKFESILSRQHLDNKNIKPKNRQQLQYLREIGLLEFVERGIYKKLWS